MRFRPSIFSQLVEAISRRQFAAIVARHHGDAYDKRFHSWDHLLVLLFAQFCPADSLRGLQASWNANRQHHYHLGTGPMARSTLSDANRRRPVAVFADLFSHLAAGLGRTSRREGAALLRLIDSTPIPLPKLCEWAKSNGRIRGLKMHVVYDPQADSPRLLDITHANVNDALIGRTVAPEAGATYVFDKGYCHYGWWTAIAAAGASFVTRPKTSMKLALVAERPVDIAAGDGFTVLGDQLVRFASKGDSKLAIPLRRITVRRLGGDTITLLTNDTQRPAVAIAALYKARWQIELLFRWIKQHLRIRSFLANNLNAIRLQLVAAMIAYVLVRLAAKANKVALPILRFLDLLAQCFFERRLIANIEKPPPVNPARTSPKHHPDQLGFTYA
jgi:putative transposase